MSSQNPLHEPNQTTQPQKQASSESSQESKKNELHHQSADEHDVEPAAAAVPEEGGKIGATAPPQESHGRVVAEDGSGRERLKRHRVEMSGRVWIPDMWGQEDLLKEWVDCAAFDAKLVSSSIMIARDSLKEEGRRANSIIENAELVVANLFD